jgi:hypothetical protein
MGPTVRSHRHEHNTQRTPPLQQQTFAPYLSPPPIPLKAYAITFTLILQKKLSRRVASFFQLRIRVKRRRPLLPRIERCTAALLLLQNTVPRVVPSTMQQPGRHAAAHSSFCTAAGTGTEAHTDTINNNNNNNS